MDPNQPSYSPIFRVNIQSHGKKSKQPIHSKNHRKLQPVPVGKLSAVGSRLWRTNLNVKEY